MPNEPTTDLPTEPGYYLFIGERSPSGFEPKRTRPELVKITKREDGSLIYIGSDMFYHPSKAVGAWQRVEFDGLSAMSERAVYGHYATKCVEAICSGTWATRRLASAFRRVLGTSYGEVRLWDESKADGLVKAAVRLGLVEDDE